MNAIKLVGLAMIFTVSALITRQTRPELALAASLAGGVFILLSVIDLLTGVVAGISSIASGFGLNMTYINVALKAVGIGYLVQFASEICGDAGEASLASKVEFAGKLMILALAMPIVTDIVAMARGLLSL